jgi:hypothetical protein
MQANRARAVVGLMRAVSVLRATFFMNDPTKQKTYAQTDAQTGFLPGDFGERGRLKSRLFSMWCPERESNSQGVATGGF